MQVDPAELLQALPPRAGKNELIDPQQGVFEIMKEVLRAHDVFRADYDRICEFFNFRTVEQVCESLFDFCKRNIRYVVESEDSQTSRSPGVLLYMGGGDCKHYSGFIGGVLCALNRNFDRKINWCYRFASYNLLEQEPQHVFVVVEDSGNDIWIDPVLKTFNQRHPQPWYYIDKRPKMAMNRLSGVGTIGFVDPGTIATVLQFVSAFGKDQVPNYPIKSGNTFEKLKGIVQQKVQPMPPQNVAQAQTALAAAKSALAGEQGGSGAANETIKMMYNEIIASLQNYINSGGTLQVQTPGGGMQTVTPVIKPVATQQQAGMNPIILLGLAGGALYMANKKPKARAVNGPGKIVLPLLIAGAVYLFIQSQNKDKEKTALKEFAPEGAAAFDAMTPDELHDCYVFLINYMKDGRVAQVPADLRARIDAIGIKYNIFT